MLNAVIKYGGISAKCRALYSKMLSAQDWHKLCASRGLPDLLSVLRSSSAWNFALSSLSASMPTHAELISVIRAQVRDEDERLYRLASNEDKKYLDFAVCRVEYYQILSSIRRLMSTNRTPPPPLSRFVIKKSPLDFSVLENAASFSDIQRAAANSLYADPLRNTPIDSTTGLPDYAAVSVQLEKRYYSAVYNHLIRKYSGIGKVLLVKSVGLEADMLNVMHILRMHRYFPASLGKASELLIPISHDLSQRFAAKLIAAPSLESAVSLIRSTRWAFFSDEPAPGQMERHFSAVMENFYRKLIHTPIPSLCVPLAYLSLKESEGERLIRVIEALRLGVAPEQVL